MALEQGEYRMVQDRKRLTIASPISEEAPNGMRYYRIHGMRITYDDVLNFHKEKNAACGIYKDMPQMDPKDLSRHTLIETILPIESATWSRTLFAEVY